MLAAVIEVKRNFGRRISFADDISFCKYGSRTAARGHRATAEQNKANYSQLVKVDKLTNIECDIKSNAGTERTCPDRFRRGTLHQELKKGN